MQYQRESTNDREILRRVRQLSPQQVVEVVDFIDFLITRFSLFELCGIVSLKPSSAELKRWICHAIDA